MVPWLRVALPLFMLFGSVVVVRTLFRWALPLAVLVVVLILGLNLGPIISGIRAAL